MAQAEDTPLPLVPPAMSSHCPGLGLNRQRGWGLGTWGCFRQCLAMVLDVGRGRALCKRSCFLKSRSAMCGPKQEPERPAE